MQVEKRFDSEFILSINLQHDARQEWLVSMQISMNVFFSW